METKFFDENNLREIEISDEVRENFRNLNYNFKEIDEEKYFFCQLGDMRLNSSEIKALIKLNSEKKFLTDADFNLLNYMVHKLTDTQSYYKILNDFALFFSYLKNSKFDVFYFGEKIKIVDKFYKIKFNLEVNDEGSVELDIRSNGDFILGQDKAFYLEDDVLYKLSDKLPVNLYTEIIDGNNIFSVDSFFSFQKKYLDVLKSEHNLNISKDVENLQTLNLKEKVAPLILEVDKTNHFVIIELKYDINGERYNISDYTYADTIGWIDKTNLIKVIKEKNGLVKYLSDESLSEDIFDDIFEGSRIMYKRYMKTPFRIMLPIFQLNNFVSKVMPQAEKIVDIDYKGGKKIELADGKVKFDVNAVLNKKLDLFEFKLKFKVEDEYFDLDYIKELMLKSRKYVQLKSGKTINIENIREINRWLEFLKQFIFEKKTESYKGSIENALELDKFLEDVEFKQVHFNEDLKNLIQELKDKKPINPISLPKQVDKILRPYQKEGIYWMHFLKKYGFGGILADEMGLGKTLQALTILRMESKGTHIVICPKTLIYNWESEVKKFFPGMKCLVIDGDNEKRKKLISEIDDYDLAITSYSMLQKDYEVYLEEDVEFNYAILDEAHYVKNIKTLSAKAVRLINAENKILLTGTPLENNLTELFSAFDLMMPGFLGSKSDFSKDFVSKIERNNMIALEILQAKIRPFILRRTKKEVLHDLPDKQEQIVFSEMTNKQAGIYNELLNRVKKEINDLVQKQGFERSRIQILSALLKLRQICNHPSLVDEDFVGEEELSGKYEQFKMLLGDVIERGSKILVFSQFTSMLDIFQQDMEHEKIKYLRLDGSTKNRQELVNKFNDDDSIKVFLISLKAGGVGLNLTSADTVFLYDPWWNPMVEKQAQDRAHRIGQKKTVNVYKFITKNSIEEKILKLQETKGNLFENLVVEDKGFIKKLEWEDLMELFE